MKIKTLILLLTLSTFSCNFIYGQTNKDKITVKKKNKIKARLIVCSGISEKKIPLDNLKEINVKEGEKVFLYVKWFNLTKKSYVTTMDFLDADGNYLSQSREYKFKSRKNSHNTWNSLKFREIIIPEGIVKIRINLDEEIISEREISVKYITE